MTIEIINEIGRLLFLMAAGHALADGPLQDQAIVVGKRPNRPFWDQVQSLAKHGLIHGGIVALITGLWWLGVAETIMHVAIDASKARGRLTHFADQALHITCKVIWMTIAINA